MPVKTSNYGLVKPLATEYYDVNVQNQNIDIIDKEMMKISSDNKKRIDELEADMNDNQLKLFETDVLMTKLEDCNGGFVNLDKIEGKTLVNLSKFTTVNLNTDVYETINTTKSNTIGRTVTIVNNSGRKVTCGLTINDVRSRNIVCLTTLTNIVLANNEVVHNIYSNTSNGWTEGNKNDLLKVMVLDGEVKTPINGYFEGMGHVGEEITLENGDKAYRIEILSKNKNWVKNGDGEEGLSYWESKQGNATITLNPNGGFLVNTSAIFCGYWQEVKVKQNTNYTLSAIGSSKDMRLTIRKGSSKNDTGIASSVSPVSFNTGNEKTIWVLFEFNSIISNATISKIQLEEDIKSTEYESYDENKTEILLPEPLRGIPNVVQDIINGDGIIYRNCGEYKLDVNSGWSLYKNLTNVMAFACKVNNIKTYKVISDKFPMRVYDPNADVEGVVCIENDYLYVYINKSRLVTQDVAGFKTWLQDNPITVVYQLLTPTKENLNKTLISKGFENVYLQVNSGAIQPHVKGTYATNISERVRSVEDVVESVKEDIETLESAMLTVATDIADNGVYKDKAKNIDGMDINTLFTGGVYCGTNLGNAPTTESYRVEIIPSYTGKEWCKQKISRLQNMHEEFYRVYDPNLKKWSEWIKFHYIYTKVPIGRPPVIEDGMMWIE